MLAQVVQDVGLQRTVAVSLGCARLTAMKITAGAEICREARPAPPLMSFAEAVEKLQWQLVPAPTTPTRAARLPNAQGAGRQCARRSLEYSARGRRTDVAYPDTD